MEWWYWIALGFILFGGEILAPGGFFLIFFGVGAFLVGILDALGMAGPPAIQWLLFSLFSVAMLLLLRRYLLKLKAHPVNQEIDSLVGESAILLEDLAKGGTAKAELRGSAWSVKNVGNVSLAKGARVVVQAVKGVTLEVNGE